MRLFILDDAKAGAVVRAIVCAPDPSSSLDSDRATNFVTPNGGKIVLRHVGESEFSVTEDQHGGDVSSLDAAALREAENSVSLEVVYSADNGEVPAFSFLDESECIPAKKVSAQITTARDSTISDVWCFQANVANLQEYEMRLRTESVVASLVQSPSEMEANRYTDELSQAASSLGLTSNLFLPLQCVIHGEPVPCIVHLQDAGQMSHFSAEIYWCQADVVISGQVELTNVGAKSLLTATII